MYRFHTVHCITCDSVIFVFYGKLTSPKKKVKIDYKNKLKWLVNVVVYSLHEYIMGFFRNIYAVYNS